VELDEYLGTNWSLSQQLFKFFRIFFVLFNVNVREDGTRITVLSGFVGCDVLKFLSLCGCTSSSFDHFIYFDFVFQI